MYIVQKCTMYMYIQVYTPIDSYKHHVHTIYTGILLVVHTFLLFISDLHLCMSRYYVQLIIHVQMATYY
jgi:hypothetical protein